MKLRFFKTIKVGGLRLGVSNRGVRTSIGTPIKGLRVETSNHKFSDFDSDSNIKPTIIGSILKISIFPMIFMSVVDNIVKPMESMGYGNSGLTILTISMLFVFVAFVNYKWTTIIKMPFKILLILINKAFCKLRPNNNSIK